MNYADDTEDFDDDVSYDERENQDFDDRCEFADPGGRSALRAGPREYACPNCRRENRLCAKDVQLGYQCNDCADRAERDCD